MVPYLHNKFLQVKKKYSALKIPCSLSYKKLFF